MPSNLPSNTTSNLPTVHAKDGRVFANSRDVAAFFGKLHKNVLRDIDMLECSEEFRRLNFELTPIVEKIGVAERAVRTYEMTLAEMGYLYRSAANKGYRVRAAYRDTLFEERLHEASGNRTIIVTPRGKVELEGLYQRGNLPLKKGFQHAHC